MGGHHSKDKNTNLSLVSQPKQPTADTQNTTTEMEGPSWSTLLGEDNWSGLLDPLDLNLRCGDFCQATYDAFNNDANSKYAGSSRYGHANFFQKVMLQDAATAHVSVPNMSRESWDRESNWIGYIAVTSDEYSKSLGRREIYVAWRGTTREYEWVNVLGAELVSAENLLYNISNALQQKSLADAVEEGSSDGNEDENKEEHEKIPKVMRGWHSMYTSDDANSAFTK